jgi:hypothetical protein
MNRIEINVITGERKIVELNAEEIAHAQAQYAQWQADEEKRKAEMPKLLQEEIARLQAQLAELEAK